MEPSIRRVEPWPLGGERGRGSAVPVLLVGRERLGWWNGQDEARWADLDPEDPEALSEGLRALFAGQRARQRRCVVALGDGIVKIRLIPHPDLGRRDVAAVLHRKAAAMLDVAPEQVLYAARPTVAGGSRRADDGGPAQLVAATTRSEFERLRQALAARRIRADRIVPARLARLDAVAPHFLDEEDGALMIDVSDRSVGLFLLGGGAVRHALTLPGRLDDSGQLASFLLQEVRSLEMSWRKSSRGGSIRRAVILGVGAGRAERIREALEKALGGLEECRLATVGEDAAQSDGREAALDAARARGRFCPELESRGRHVAMRRVATTAALLVPAISTVSFRANVDTIQELESACSLLEAKVAGLPRLRARHESTEQLRTSVATERAFLGRLGNVGFPLESGLGEILAALRGRATLQSLVVDTTQSEGQLRLIGTGSRAPIAALHEMRAIAAALEASPRFARVRVQPPKDLDAGDEVAADALAFHVTADLEERR